MGEMSQGFCGFLTCYAIDAYQMGGMGGIAIKVKLHGMIKKGYWRSAAVYAFVGSEPMTVYGYTLPCSL